MKVRTDPMVIRSIRYGYAAASSRHRVIDNCLLLQVDWQADQGGWLAVPREEEHVTIGDAIYEVDSVHYDANTNIAHVMVDQLREYDW